MTKIKRMAVSALLAISIAAIGVTASAEQITNSSSKVTFKWGKAYASTTNLSTTSRYAESFIDIYNNTTGSYVTSGSSTGVIGYNQTKSASCSGYTSGNYNYTASMYIRYSSVPQSSVEARHIITFA